MLAYKPLARKKLPMLSNGPRPQLGMAFALAALQPVVPWIIAIGAAGLSLIGLSYLARNEAQKWKEASGLNLQNIPQAVLSGGAGAIALAVSGQLDGVAKTVATSLGIAGLAGSLYLMFSGTPAPPPPPAPSPTGSMPNLVPAKATFPAPVWQSEILRDLTLSFPPTQENTGGTDRSIFVTNQPFEFLVGNESSRDMDFFAGANIYNEDEGTIFSSDTKTPPYNRVHVVLGPRGTETAAKSVKILTPTQSLAKRNVAVSIELFRHRDDPQPFKISDPIDIRYTFSG